MGLMIRGVQTPGKKKPDLELAQAGFKSIRFAASKKVYFKTVIFRVSVSPPALNWYR